MAKVLRSYGAKRRRQVFAAGEARRRSVGRVLPQSVALVVTIALAGLRHAFCKLFVTMKSVASPCKTRALTAAAFCAWSAMHAAGAAPGPWQEGASIRAAAEEAVRVRFANVAARLTISAEQLDPRLRMPACDVPLVGELPAATRESARVTAEVRCPGIRPWRLFVPVQVTVLRSLVVTVAPLERGKVLAAGDVKLAEREVSAAPSGYLTSMEAVVGQVLRRSVPADAVLAPGLLEAPVLVRRGQAVTLEARSGTIVVQMAGIAKSEGALGQTIAVENSSSRKVLQAVVRNEKSVEVLLP
jgi:flagella basal body P-ring formation protein FlgA